ncbi:MAG: hypothetical protein K9J82_01145 [Methylotenera sp.]|nr:hypothetical protein [Methylotenera sp.]
MSPTPTLTHDQITELLHRVDGCDCLLPWHKRALSSLLIQAQLPPALQFRPLPGGGWLTDAGVWRCDGAGAWVLHLVAHNPGRWLELRQGQTLRAWRQATARARDSLIHTDPKLAALLAPADSENGPGVRFEMRNGRVHVRWRPPPGRAVAVGVPL